MSSSTTKPHPLPGTNTTTSNNPKNTSAGDGTSIIITSHANTTDRISPQRQQQQQQQRRYQHQRSKSENEQDDDGGGASVASSSVGGNDSSACAVAGDDLSDSSYSSSSHDDDDDDDDDDHRHDEVKVKVEVDEEDGDKKPPSRRDPTKRHDMEELLEGLSSLDISTNQSAAADSLPPPAPKVVHDKVCNSQGLKMVAQWIKRGECTNILVLSGAGVSCSAGIPDFRTPGTGLYDNLQKYNLPNPEAVFDVQFYRTNPFPFISLAKEIWPGIKHSPTLTHSFISLLHSKNLLLRNYTQNIDGLEILSNIPETKLVECHGHFRTASCIDCKYQQPNDDDDDDDDHGNTDDCKQIMLNRHDQVPTCTRCGGHVKPDIVFFGESLPPRFGALISRDVARADLLLVIGTSLMVAPVSFIPGMVNKSCRRVLLNRELVGDFENDAHDDDDDDDRNQHGGMINKLKKTMKKKKKHEKWTRDVFEKGDCDDSVWALCRLLGWEEELLKLNESTRITSKKQPNMDEKEEGKRN